MESIRSAQAADAAALAELHLDVWDDGYAGLIPQRILDARRAEPASARIARWVTRLESSPTWVAEDAQGLAGFASYGPGRDDTDLLELMALYVRARVYGTGVGHRLLEASVGQRPAYLWVLDGNTRAITFYERQGFRFDGQVQDCDEGPERRMVRP